MTSNLDMTQNNDFKIDNITNYLKDHKETLKGLSILDKNELNKDLTNKLNNLLLPQKTFEEKYTFIISKMTEVETNIDIIKKQIEEFNNNEGFVSFIDVNDILYITYFDEISFVDKTIAKIIKYIKKNINLNYLYCYIINKFYDELTDDKRNYLFILEKRIIDIYNKIDKTIIELTEEQKNEQKILDFFSINKIKILKDIIKLIFDSDESYKNIIKKYNNDKFEFLKEIYSDNNILGETKEILDFKPYFAIKTDFIEGRKKFLKNKRDIVLDEPKLQIFYNKLFTEQNVITIEIWYGFILFITKHFTIAIDILMDFFNKKLNPEFLIEKDKFNDLETPMAEYAWKEKEKVKIGGNISFYKKYLKYKNKYLLTKKKLQYGGETIYLQIYVFTKEPILPINKTTLFNILEQLYGQNNILEITDFSDPEQITLYEDIKEYVYDKGEHYPTLKHITFFRIINVPSRLIEGEMDDPKLTYEEYAIRKLLNSQNAPFKLVNHGGNIKFKNGYGIWSYGDCIIPSHALIPLELK